MEARLLCILLIGVLTFGICRTTPLNTNEEAARKFAQEVSTKMFELNDKYSRKIVLGADEKGAADEVMNIYLEKDKLILQIIKEAKQFDDSKFTDPELKNIFNILKKPPGDIILGEEKSKKIHESLTMLDELASDRDIPAYRNESIKLAYFPDIQEIFAKSNDPRELKYYWKTWRDKNGVWATSHFVKLVKLFKEAAELNKISAFEAWMEDYNITEMENIMTQIEPFYLQLHGFIRYQLHKKYGDSVIKLRKPIPHHLFEQVLAQAWTPGSIIDDMYPHKNLPPYDEILEKNNFDTLKMFKTADQFYKSLGFDSISDEYWQDHFKMNADEDEGDCKATVFNESPIVYMQYCQKMDFRKFLQAHGFMAELYYAREEAALPSFYFAAYGLEFPVGEAVILSASTPKHLNAIGLVTDYKFTEEVKMNRLLRMGIHTLLYIPVYFVHTKVMADLFAGTVDIIDLNKHYWRLMVKYVGVEPPVNRGSDAYDFPFKFYTGLNNKEDDQASKFMTEVLGYQFYEKLCEISGQYSKSVDSEPINNCDFYGSKVAGDALKKMMKLGSSKPLREVLSTLLPENPSVNASSLLEYYAPMKSWLMKKNSEDNVRTGWTHSRKKISIVTNYESEEED